MYDRDKYFKKHALVLKGKLASKSKKKYASNVQDEEMIEKEFVIINQQDHGEIVDSVDDETFMANFATLREPLLEDTGLL